ncbi:MAG: hypothetical protein QW078_00355 [Thermoplasmatales archaeon]
MSITISISFAVFLLAVFFLILSLIVITRRYTVKNVLISLFFLIITLEYGIFLYFEFQGQRIGFLLFSLSNLFMLLLLVILMITR